ncbi:23S rRNA (pseudouridine(1915)-N(3))-methyltransferase RlmH [Thermodesulfobacteriota bacterium]
MKFELLLLGKNREKYLAAGIEDYHKRLLRFLPVELRIIKEKKFSGAQSDDEIKKEEGKIILSRLPKGACLIALDPGGREIDSQGLASFITQLESQGRNTLCFIIGGSLGLSRQVLSRADYILSLSQMTFTHEMARLILLEQLYRACNIRAGTAYHK